MTAALVAGLGLLVYGMATRTASLGDGTAPFGSIELPVPAGATVKAVVADGGLIYLHVAAPAGDRVVVIEGRTGRLIGEMSLTPAAP